MKLYEVTYRFNGRQYWQTYRGKNKVTVRRTFKRRNSRSEAKFVRAIEISK